MLAKNGTNHLQKRTLHAYKNLAEPWLRSDSGIGHTVMLPVYPYRGVILHKITRNGLKEITVR